MNNGSQVTGIDTSRQIILSRKNGNKRVNRKREKVTGRKEWGKGEREKKREKRDSSLMERQRETARFDGKGATEAKTSRLSGEYF